ncbi:hypothetical protein ACET3Z_028822 [Daucus carota]
MLIVLKTPRTHLIPSPNRQPRFFEAGDNCYKVGQGLSLDARAQKLALQHSRSGFKPKKSMEVLTRFGISCLGSKLCGGPILKKEGISIGVVTAIATPESIKVDLEGNGGHAILVQPLALQLYYSHNHSDLQLLPDLGPQAVLHEALRIIGHLNEVIDMANIGKRAIHYLHKISAANNPTVLIEKGQNFEREQNLRDI